MNWKYHKSKFEYEEKFQDLAWPWAGHKFFAYDLVANMKPKIIVELGTHYGTSFWSFSQAVKDQKIETELNAVDSWEGERHAGFYGEEVFETVNKIKDKFYSDLKINLVRKNFDDAVFDFEDNSIDILHIDGLHTYEAVKHDFESWLPKVKNDGIILFHDIVVTRSDFGVFRLWRELKEVYETMEFRYSYGLGVLFVGAENPIFNIKNELELHYSYLIEDVENEKMAALLGKSIFKESVIQQKDQEIQQINQAIKQKTQEIDQRAEEIVFMQSSKFWKLRNQYIYLRNGIEFALSHPERFIIKRIKRIKKLYISATCSFLNEGLGKTVIRTKNYILYGKGVLKKSDLKNRQGGSKLFPYNMSHIELLDIKTVENINFVKYDNPVVSIIIPVFNKWKYTYNCLESLMNNIGDVLYEIIVVDDGSSDETNNLIANKIAGIVYVKNEKNLGFVGSCNAGARKAKGEYVVFLNNDTSINPGWLESLLETFENHKNVGLVGSKLIYPDGRLQEAGGIVWKNENVWNYGRLMNPMDYEFNYFKDVDYCSGASIILPRNIFEKLNGFDDVYSPGYFEDTDLAFRVRQIGLRTAYQPKSELYHFEGITSGTDLNSGMKKYQVVNKKTFFGRWKDVLAEENINDDIDGPFLARDRSKNKKVILFMDNNVPTFDRDAGSFVVFKYLEVMIGLGYKVIFWPHNLNNIHPYTEKLQQMGVEVVYGKKSFKEFMKERGKFIDFSFISRPHVADEYLDCIKKYSKAKTFYIAQDLHFLREERIAKIEKDEGKYKMALRTKELEKEIMEKADRSLFFSDKEVGIVKSISSLANPIIAPWVQETFADSKSMIFSSRKNIVFVGGFGHPPNIDAIKWFHDEIFPKVKSMIPDVIISVIGSNAPDEILNLNSDNFKILGFLSDEERDIHLKKARIFIAPLRVGAGFKGKIALAMAHALPVVTTDIGAEGIGLVDGENAMIANNSDEFSEKIIKLCQDENIWRNISNNAYDHVSRRYSVSVTKEFISKLIS